MATFPNGFIYYAKKCCNPTGLESNWQIQPRSNRVCLWGFFLIPCNALCSNLVIWCLPNLPLGKSYLDLVRYPDPCLPRKTLPLLLSLLCWTERKEQWKWVMYWKDHITGHGRQLCSPLYHQCLLYYWPCIPGTILFCLVTEQNHSDMYCGCQQRVGKEKKLGDGEGWETWP